MPVAIASTLSQRLDALRAAKMTQTREKWDIIGSMDHDDWALVLPPPAAREVVRTVSGSGVPITDVILKGFSVEPNDPSGGFFGPRACGRNFRRLLEIHPVYVDPISSLAGAYMVNFMSYRKPHWQPDPAFGYAHLAPEHQRYHLIPGIGGAQHFCQDLQIGLDLGWSGMLEKIRRHREVNPGASDFYAGLEDIVLGMQDWIARHAAAAETMAATEPDPALRANLIEIAEINDRLVTEPPHTFREACQWILWYQMAARMYNGSGSLGRLDVLLEPYYERDVAAGILDDEEAIFHVACLLLRDTAYLQLGGPLADGSDATNPLSFLVLEAAHRLNVPANIGVCVGPSTDPACCAAGWRSCSTTEPAPPSSSAWTTPPRASRATAIPSSWPARAPTPAATGSRSPAASTP